MNKQSYNNTFHTQANHLTQLFVLANQGEKQATDQLLDILYAELKQIATSRRNSFKDNRTLNTTALVNETWLKLKKSEIKYNNKQHFLSLAAIAMRQILLDAAKSKNRLKTPNFVTMEQTSEIKPQSIEHEAEWLYQLDLILVKLEKHSPRRAAVFNLKFFCGFTLNEIAEIFNLSLKTIHREWESAKYIIKTTFELS